MRRVIICFLFTFLINSNFSANNSLDSLLNVLDKTVKVRHEYAEQKEQLIKGLKQQLDFATVDKQRIELEKSLFWIYNNYQTDSAYRYAKDLLTLANKVGNPMIIAEANMNIAEVLRTTGMFKEALEQLDDINAKGLGKYNQRYLMHLYHSLYLLMGEYSISEDDKKVYNGYVFNYKDSILQITPQDEISYYLVTSTKNIMLGKYDEALAVMQKAYSLDIEPALVSYTLSEIYQHLGKPKLQKKYLAESAIADLREGKKEYMSLQELAIILFNEGDIDRAYNYMEASIDDAIFCNARLRTLEISKMLPVISNTYNIKMKEERTRLYWISIIAILLAIILLASIIYIYRQVKTLSSIRKYQKKMNVELKAMNDELNKANSRLLDSNLIKEEYIGYVFNICSLYIDKLENFRVAVNRKIKAGQIAELEKATATSTLVADELKEFYKNFDSIFLNIYPSFVEDFNRILLEDGKIIPKDGELLTPELRIFALVRLGITDSVKIANFLHYSPQTIYNYRLKIRNKISISKDDFPTYLSKIGIENS